MSECIFWYVWCEERVDTMQAHSSQLNLRCLSPSGPARTCTPAHTHAHIHTKTRSPHASLKSASFEILFVAPKHHAHRHNTMSLTIQPSQVYFQHDVAFTRHWDLHDSAREHPLRACADIAAPAWAGCGWRGRCRWAHQPVGPVSQLYHDSGWNERAVVLPAWVAWLHTICRCHSDAVHGTACVERLRNSLRCPASG